MFMNVTCPECGKKRRVPERAFGQQINCPTCSALIPCDPVSPPAPETGPTSAGRPPAVAAPQVRLAEEQSAASIRYSCPRCHKPLESPAQAAGQKVNCPNCGQRLQTPQPSHPLASVPVRVVASPPAPPAPPPPVKQGPIPAVVKVSAWEPASPARRKHCLGYRADVTDRPPIATTRPGGNSGMPPGPLIRPSAAPGAISFGKCREMSSDDLASPLLRWRCRKQMTLRGPAQTSGIRFIRLKWEGG
jgi:DNA-directed RNA polymerase subunit RPC12/RpoP